MMIYRGLVVGLLGAIAMLIASRPVALPAPRAVVQDHAWAPADPPAADTIVDARRGSRDALGLVGLGARERIVAIDDRACAACDDELERRWAATDAQGYLDVTVASPRGPRRVLLLAHAPPR